MELSISFTNQPEIMARLKGATLALRQEIGDIMREGAEEFGRNVKAHQLSRLKGSTTWAGVKHPTGKLAASGRAWAYTRDWGAVAGYQFDAESAARSRVGGSRGRARARYGYILQAGVDTDRPPPMWSKGQFRKKRRRNAYARKGFHIAPVPFIARELEVSGPTIEAKMKARVEAVILGALDGR